MFVLLVILLFGGVFLKITRYINGKKVNGAMPSNVVIENDIISEAIAKVNERTQKKRKIGLDLNE